MRWLIIKSWILLLHIDFIMYCKDFRALHDIVREQKVVARKRTQTPDVEQLCHAVELACVFYFKQVMCLQRSSVATCMLRRYGWNAEMVIGARIRPFNSHAWVEIDGKVVNDKPDMLDIYQVLERC